MSVVLDDALHETNIDPAIHENLARLFDASVAVAAARPRLVNEALYPLEQDHVSHAVQARQAEFGTARILARRLLAALGADAVSLHPYPDRSPRWPKNVVGTISHTKNLCAVALARADQIVGLGLDIETAEPLEQELEPIICTAGERAGLIRLPQEERGRAAKLIFCAKEAFHKCQYPIARLALDFTDISIQLDRANARFTIIPHCAHATRILQTRRFSGLLDAGGDFLMASATLSRS